jgi:hypothetical protein
MWFFCVLGHVWVFVNSKLTKDLERGGCDVAGVLAQNVTEYLVSRLTVKNEVNYVALGGLVVSVLAIRPKVRGFDPDRGRWIFKGDKNP